MSTFFDIWKSEPVAEIFRVCENTPPTAPVFPRAEPTPRDALDELRQTTGCARMVLVKEKKDANGKVVEKNETVTSKIHHSYKGMWGQKWVSNTAEIPTGAQDIAISCCNRATEVTILSYCTYRAWGNIGLDELGNLAASDLGLYEVLPAAGRRKVYFDVDGENLEAKGGPNKAQKLRDDYEKVKGIVVDYFPGARLQISGSDVPKKYSLHIVISNYYAESVAATEVIQRFAQKHKEEYGFDGGVYTKNRNMKMINQSKREKDKVTGRLKEPRIQAYVEGDTDIRKHFIMSHFDDDAIDIGTLERLQEDFKTDPKMRGNVAAGPTCGSVLDIPQYNLQSAEDFDLHSATPMEKLLQIPPDKLVHDVTWKIMLFCRTVGLSFEDFWAWARAYKDDAERQRKYLSAWQSPVEYSVSETLLDNILLRFYPRIKEQMAVKRMRKQFELADVRNNGKQWLSSADIDKETAVTMIVATMGAGKTVTSIDFSAKHFKSKRILWVTCRITLTHNTLEKLAKSGLSPKCYLDLTKKEKHADNPFEGAKHVVCSVTSLNLLKGLHDFDLVVIDELETVLGTFGGGQVIHREKLHSNWQEFVRVLKAAKKILALDGIATNTSVEFLKGVRTSIEVLTNSPNPDRSPFCFLEYERRVDWLAGMADSLRGGKKIYIFVPYKDKRGVEDLGSSIQAQFGMGDEAVLRYHALRKEEKRALRDPDTVWNDPRVRVVISNATNGVGVDHSTPDIFDELWCMYSNFLPAREFFQAIRRIRNPRSNTLHLFREQTRSRPKQLKDSTVLFPLNDPAWEALTRNLEIEEKADLQSSSNEPQRAREMFCLFAAKCAMLIYPGPSVRMSDKVREKTEEMFAGEGSVFDFESIGALEGSEFTEALARINSNVDTMDDALRVEKAYFLQMFKDIEDRAARELWDDAREFAKKAHEMGADPNHTIAKILAHNGVSFGEPFGEEMTCECVPQSELVQILPKSRNPLRNYTVDLTSKVLNSYFGMECYIRTKKRKDGKFVYVTSKAYLQKADLCRRALRVFQAETPAFPTCN